MERERVATQRDRRNWTVLGFLLGVSALVVLGQSMSEAESWLGRWAWYLAGIDFFCVTSRVANGGEENETGRGEAESD